MIRYIRRRVIHFIVVLLMVTFVALVLMDLSPGGLAATVLGEEATPERIAEFNRRLGLDDPLAVRYVQWLGNVAQADFGRSLLTGIPVLEILKQRLPVTLQLAIMAQLIAIILAVPAAMLAAHRRDSVLDRATNGLASALISSPQFVTALLLIFLLSLTYAVFPPIGWVPITQDLGQNLRRAFLPALTLGLTEAAVYMRLLRSDLSATLQQDFVLFAKAKGLPDWYIMLRHVLRPSSFSFVTLFGINFARLIGGTVVIETIFALPGLGRLLVQSVFSKDYIVVQGLVMVVAFAYVTLNLVVDLAYAKLDPRVASERA